MSTTLTMRRITVDATEGDTFAILEELAERLHMPMGDVIRVSLSLLSTVVCEVDAGNVVKVERGDELTELVVAALEHLESSAERG